MQSKEYVIDTIVKKPRYAYKCIRNVFNQSRSNGENVTPEQQIPMKINLFVFNWDSVNKKMSKKQQVPRKMIFFIFDRGCVGGLWGGGGEGKTQKSHH